MGGAFGVQLLGPFRVMAESNGAIEFPARSAAALVAYCALRRSPVSRGELASALWPDADPDSGRTNLRTALHRVKKAAPDLIEGDGDLLRLGKSSSDIEEADQFHRQFLLAPSDPAAVECLAREWGLRKKPLLEGWNDEWIEPLRTAAWFAATEIGRDLAKAAEASGDPATALRTWHELLLRAEGDFEAVKQIVRLEGELHGRDTAQRVAEDLNNALPPDCPEPVRRYLASVRSGAIEAVPKPEFLRSRSEILLLARMFESNLRSNSEEALGLLLKEARTEANLHPRTAFSLVQLALSQTSGTSPMRVQLAILAGTLGSWVAEYELGQHWSRFALENLDPKSADYVATLSTHGFMFLEQRQHEEAEATLTRAIALARTSSLLREELMSRVGLAGVYLQTMRFDEAIAMYRSIAEEAEAKGAPNRVAAHAATNSNISLIYVMQGRWQDAISAGELALTYAADLPIYQWLTAPHLGLARYKMGDRAAGIAAVRFGVLNTAREKLLRYNQIALDFAAMVLACEGDTEMAKAVVDVGTVYRASIHHHRSVAERHLLASVTGLAIGTEPPSDNRLANQSVATLNTWVCDILSDLV